MRKRFCLLALCLCLLTPLAVADSLPYGGYATTPYGGVAPSPVGYDVDAFLSGDVMGAGAFQKPEDFYLDTVLGVLYIADTGNHRVVAVNTDFQFMAEYAGAGDVAFVSPKGVFSDGKGLLYVADDGLGQVVVMTTQGELERVLERPESDLYEEATPFMPQKVVADSAGRVYVLSQGVYQGLICYQADGSFLNFYGANHVEVTAKVVMQKLLRALMTREQRAGLESFIPIEYSNIDIDAEDMVFAAVGTLEQTASNSAYKLNPLGAPYRKIIAGPLIDLLADQNGYYTCLRKDTKVVVEFASESNGVLLTCGGNGAQKGLFQDPVAIARLGEKLLVLDRQNGMITCFAPTAFGRLVHDAIRYSADGQYQQAIEVFQALIRMDSHYTYAYQGLGKAYYEMERYEDAIHYYRLANDKQGYSDAFKEYSTGLLRANMAWILLGAVALIALCKLRGHIARKHGRAHKRAAPTTGWRHPFRCMTHAYSAFEGVKLEGHGSLVVGGALLALLFLSAVVGFVLTGFAFNPNRIEQLNVLLLLAGSLGSFSLFYVSSLAVSSLMSDCEGKPKELFIVETYALLPYILGAFLVAVITNFLTLDVSAFITIFMAFCVGWSVILLFVGMMQVNQLTVKQTLLYLLLVLLALAIVLVLLVLLYSLVQQFMVFIQTLYSEVMYRM